MNATVTVNLNTKQCWIWRCEDVMMWWWRGNMCLHELQGSVVDWSMNNDEYRATGLEPSYEYGDGYWIGKWDVLLFLLLLFMFCFWLLAFCVLLLVGDFWLFVTHHKVANHYGGFWLYYSCITVKLTTRLPITTVARKKGTQTLEATLLQAKYENFYLFKILCKYNFKLYCT